MVAALLFWTIATASWRSCRHPGRSSHHRATPRHANAIASGDPTPKPAPLAGSPSVRSMTVCDQRKISPNSPASNQLANTMNANPSVGVGSPNDSRSAICSDASCDASRTRPWTTWLPTSPAMPIASETLSPVSAHNCASSSKWSAMFTSTRQPVASSMVRGAMRIDSWLASSAGSASAIRRARSQLTRAAPRSRLVDHAAARMCQPYAACSSPAASRCSAISAAFSSTEPGRVLGSRRPGAGAIGRDRISAVIRRPPRGSADGGRRTRRLAVNFT